MRNPPRFPLSCTSRLRISLGVLLLVCSASVAQAGVNIWTTSGPGGGNIAAIAIDPKHPTTVYAASGPIFSVSPAGGAGGIFKSSDGGTSWAAISRGLPNPYVSALAIDPGTTTTVYAATAAGVAKTTNGGLDWEPSGLDGLQIWALAIDPTAPATVYAAAGRSVFKSIDGGQSWATTTASPSCDTQSLAIDPNEPSTLYAGTCAHDATSLMKSVDGGVTWSAMGTGDPFFFLFFAVADRTL